MSTPILATKLYVPPLQPRIVPRPRLVERLNEGQHRRLTLVSAPAGFGKTTLLGEWLAGCDRPAAWLSSHESRSIPGPRDGFWTSRAAVIEIEPPSGSHNG